MLNVNPISAVPVSTKFTTVTITSMPSSVTTALLRIQNRMITIQFLKKYQTIITFEYRMMVFVNKPGKKRLHLRGIFPGAKVSRGKHWNYGDEVNYLKDI